MTGPDAASGRLTHIAGPVVIGTAVTPLGLGEVARVGRDGLLAEVIALEGAAATMQVFEETAGLRPGDPFRGLGAPLCVELGPGLLGAVFDGIQRPLEALAASDGDFLGRGSRVPALARERVWMFEPRVETGATVGPGAVIGVVRETSALDHRILVPPTVGGTVRHIARAGPYRVTDEVATVERVDGGVEPVRLMQVWRVRTPRPVAARLPPVVPLVTGQRVLDTFFPIAKGGAAGMPGGFGTGKTIMQQQLCKWAQADAIVFVGCGERGNEMTQMLSELPGLTDPRNGRPLAERTILIANTSNMPVSAREASIYTGLTIAEYYRDMGYDVVMLADSTSRWAEALREISGRLEEMPAEEGHPSYLSSRLAGCYERAGRATTLGGDEGSVSIISAISPPGGDLTEPVTRHTQRFTRCFWTLDKDLAEARVFPAVSVQQSYSHASAELAAWWTREVSPDWPRLRLEALTLLEDAKRLEGTARLIGTESLPERQQFVLRVAALLEEGFLRQNAFDPIDAFCPPARQYRLLALLLKFRDAGMAAIEAGVAAKRLGELDVLQRLERAKSSIDPDDDPQFDELEHAIDAACREAGDHGLPSREP